MFKLLIIDDEKLIREGLVNYIDWAGLDIEVAGTAGDGQAALQLIDDIQPDIIISDIKMPSMDGIGLLNKLREDGSESEVIFISAYSNFEYAQSALKYGAFDYILKPIEETALIETVRKCEAKICKTKSDKKGEKAYGGDDEETDKAQAARNNSGQAGLVVPGNVKRLITLAIDYIGYNYGKDVYLADVADHLYISPSYLSRIFKESTGESFSEYLLKYRVEKAKALLADPKYKVYEISKMVGYSDVCHFTKIFKKVTGLTPAKYKNTI